MAAGGNAPLGLDFDPLDRRSTWAERRGRPRAARESSDDWIFLVMLPFWAGLGVVSVVAVGQSVDDLLVVPQLSEVAILVFFVLLGLLCAAAVPVSVWAIVRWLAHTEVDGELRREGFAAANGLSPREGGRGRPGILGDDADQPAAVIDAIARTDDRPLEFGTVDVGRTSSNESPTPYPYLLTRLAQDVPHLVIQGRAGGGWMPLPVQIDTPSISLEGSFDRSFRVFAPDGYERDALYLLTPDVMACMLDTASGLSVEVLDDRLTVFAVGMLDPRAPVLWRRLAVAAEALGDQLGRQAARYRDARAAGSTPLTRVAAGARRTRRIRGRVAKAGRRLPSRGDRSGLYLGMAISAFVYLLALLGNWGDGVYLG